MLVAAKSGMRPLIRKVARSSATWRRTRRAPEFTYRVRWSPETLTVWTAAAPITVRCRMRRLTIGAKTPRQSSLGRRIFVGVNYRIAAITSKSSHAILQRASSFDGTDVK
jgi:hypothetical protein